MVAGLVAASCGDSGGAPATVSSVAPAATTVSSTVPVGPLAAFPTAEIGVGDEVWLVAVAETAELRARGLMGVTDLGALDGMLFAWDADATSGFWMKDTLIPLDVAFFEEEGTLVEVLSMVPCEAGPCPTYRPSAPYRYALEAPAGRLSAMGDIVLAVP